ncbi:hypothetical protein [Acidovorax phage AP1]|nr:hypothetical protein [Acidovorax phage AP1]
MKFPKYALGAQGSLLVAQALDADRLRPYAEVRDREQTVQKKGEFLYVEVDEETQEAERIGPFWLSIATGTRARTHSRPPYDVDEEPFEIGTTDFWGKAADGATKWGERDTVYVGGGYTACLMFSAIEGKAWPMLWHVDRLDQRPIEAGTPDMPARANVSFLSYGWEGTYQPFGSYGELAPSLFAAGKDDAGRYWFGVLTLDPAESTKQGRTVYAVWVGNTKDRVLTRVEVPHPPRHPNLAPDEQPAWIEPTVVSTDTTLLGFSPKVFCVGPGHLLAVLVPRDPVLRGRYRDFGAGPVLTPAEAEADTGAQPLYSRQIWSPLPPDSAPYLLRSRDFGRTWALEKAEFLNPPSFQAGISYQGEITSGPGTGFSVTYVDGQTYDGYQFNLKTDLIPKLGQSFVLAAQIGGGRVALFYPRVLDESSGITQARNLGVGLWISDTNGEGFTRQPWPGDTIHPALNDVLGTPGLSTPHKVICLTPWLTGRQLSAGSGSLFIDTVMRHPWDKGQKDTVYPAGHQRTVLVSLDGGSSWVERAVPAEARPFVETWGKYVALLDPAGTNPTMLYREPWPETQFVVAKPRTDTSPAELWFFVVETDVVWVWKTNERFDAWERMYSFTLEGALMFSDLAVGTPQPLFVGDDGDSGEYLSRQNIGYPAMGEEK